jgi:hypothetical protein
LHSSSPFKTLFKPTKNTPHNKNIHRTPKPNFEEDQPQWKVRCIEILSFHVFEEYHRITNFIFSNIIRHSIEFTMNCIQYFNGKSEDKHNFSNEPIFDQFHKIKKGKHKERKKRARGLK